MTLISSSSFFICSVFVIREDGCDRDDNKDGVLIATTLCRLLCSS